MNDHGLSQPATFDRPQDRRSGWPFGILIALLVSALLLAVGAVGMVKFRHRRAYTSEAWLVIQPQRNLLIKPDENEQSLREQTAIIGGQQLLASVAQDSRIRQVPELANEPDVAAALGRQLKVGGRGQSDIYVISFTSVSPVHAQLVVQSVVDAYLALHEGSESEQGATEQRVPLSVTVFRPPTLPEKPD